MPRMISLDSECTGLDLRHGACPFLVTICDGKGVNTWWEWDVDPIRRTVHVPKKDLVELQYEIDRADRIVLQNAKFDVTGLCRIGIRWDWDKVYDTLLAGHLLKSDEAHDLTTMVLIYLGIDLEPYERAIKQATMEARRQAKSDYPDWQIAEFGMPEIPSAAKSNPWANDMWLPRAIAQREKFRKKHPWWIVCSKYANSDSASTLPLFKAQKKLLKKRKLWKIYLERLKVLPVAYEMEDRGVTLSGKRLEELRRVFSKESKKAGRTCVRIAKKLGHELELPKSGNNGSLLDFAESSTGLNLVPLVTDRKRGFGKSGRITLNKEAIQGFREQLHGRRGKFVDALLDKRKRDTAINYMEGYERFWLPLQESKADDHECDYCGSSCRVSRCYHCGAVQKQNWYRLFPSLNPTGAKTLRWSSSHPNEQNISKQEGFNLRYCFGPAPGREWWSLDAKNIELRIPAYEAGEEEMIDLFERDDEPPYYGSYHLLIFDTLHPKMFAKHGVECKQIYAATWYQWLKNGNFAVQYGAIERSGTADRAYHVKGAQKRIQRRFGKVADLNQQMIAHAEEFGYVETIPDKTVDPNRGYPLYCPKGKWGKVQPTIPFNYHVQSTAMQWMAKAMVRVQEYLNTLNTRSRLKNYFMIMQVHDELIFDFPKGKNRPKIRKIQKLMERGGDDIGVPTPVGIDYHPETWSESV